MPQNFFYCFGRKRIKEKIRLFLTLKNISDLRFKKKTLRSFDLKEPRGITGGILMP